MPFNVGDSVYVLSSDAIRRGQLARIEQVLPKKLSVQDFQEYVVEFPDAASEQFRFCLHSRPWACTTATRQVPIALKKSKSLFGPYFANSRPATHRSQSFSIFSNIFQICLLPNVYELPKQRLRFKSLLQSLRLLQPG
jgi:hypothetical protein